MNNVYQEKLTDILKGVNLGTCSLAQGIAAINALNLGAIGEDRPNLNGSPVIGSQNKVRADLRKRFGVDHE